MARTLDEWKATVLAKKAEYPALDELSSTSATAIWRLFCDIIAWAAFLLDQLFDTHKAEVSALAEASIAGNAAWLRAQILAFELGNTTLSVSADRRAIYLTNLGDEAKIVKYVAIQDQRGKALIKVAKQVDGLPAPLSNAEITQLGSFVESIKFAGTKTALQTSEADRMGIYGTIYYDGVYDLPGLKTAAKAQLNAYLAGLDFDGSVSLEKATDALQATPGVLDLFVNFRFRRATSVFPGTNYATATYSTFAGSCLLEDSTFDALTWIAK